MTREKAQSIRVRFGLAVRKRRQVSISQEELADRAELHRTYISDIERGRRNLSLDNIEKLALALELSLSELMREAEQP